MSNKARRNRPRSSADPQEIKARTGVAPAPGSVVSKKKQSEISKLSERSKKTGQNALLALQRNDYAEAGRLFKVASDSANLANANKMRSGT